MVVKFRLKGRYQEGGCSVFDRAFDVSDSVIRSTTTIVPYSKEGG